ncbi:hypothetical protein AgCh_008719 [Apium graveolens]
MSETEADLLAQVPGVLSVFQDRMLKLQTTRSWSFIVNQELLATSIFRDSTDKGVDVIIGAVDSGVWHKSKSFNDQGMGPVQKRWKGTCEATEDFPASNCNRSSTVFDKILVILVFVSLFVEKYMSDLNIWADPVAIDGFQAVEHKIMVVCSTETSEIGRILLTSQKLWFCLLQLQVNYDQNMYGGNAALKASGALSVAVPRELAGLHKAWEQYGRLPWKGLVRPAERLVHKGFKISL